MKGTKKYGNKIFIITENQTNALREEINMADYKKILLSAKTQKGINIPPEAL